MSKTLEGLYQESGRAGRDGKPADCVLWFRAGQDPSRLSSLVYSDHEGALKRASDGVELVTDARSRRCASLRDRLRDCACDGC